MVRIDVTRWKTALSGCGCTQLDRVKPYPLGLRPCTLTPRSFIRRNVNLFGQDVVSCVFAQRRGWFLPNSPANRGTLCTRRFRHVSQIPIPGQSMSMQTVCQHGLDKISCRPEQIQCSRFYLAVMGAQTPGLRLLPDVSRRHEEFS